MAYGLIMPKKKSKQNDNSDGKGVNYIGERLHLEDMHPANVFVDNVSDTPVCIDCIVKFIRN